MKSHLQGVASLPRLQAGRAVGLGACAVNVIIARHCNKRPPWDEHPTPQQVCTTEGLLRGENMARIFGTRYPVPTRLFARRLPDGEYTSRDMYLLWPLSQRYRVWVNTTFAQEDGLKLAASLLEERPTLCGQTVLVSWNHCSIPALVQALGCREEPCTTCWDDGDYDTLLWLRYEAEGDQDWRLSLRVGKERFGGFDGPSSYRECIGNPVESGNFGLPCTWRGGPA